MRIYIFFDEEFFHIDDLEETNTIQEVKLIISEKYDIPRGCLHLFLNHKGFGDDYSLQHYGIKDDDCIYLGLFCATRSMKDYLKASISGLPKKRSIDCIL